MTGHIQHETTECKTRTVFQHHRSYAIMSGIFSIPQQELRQRLNTIKHPFTRFGTDFNPLRLHLQLVVFQRLILSFRFQINVFTFHPTGLNVQFQSHLSLEYTLKLFRFKLQRSIGDYNLSLFSHHKSFSFLSFNVVRHRNQS